MPRLWGGAVSATTDEAIGLKIISPMVIITIERITRLKLLNQPNVKKPNAFSKLPRIRPLVLGIFLKRKVAGYCKSTTIMQLMLSNRPYCTVEKFSQLTVKMDRVLFHMCASESTHRKLQRMKMKKTLSFVTANILRTIATSCLP